MKRIIIGACALLTIALAGCNQNTLAALVSTLGNATSTLATMQGNPTLAGKIKADAQRASVDILAWKPGSDADMAVQAIHVVEADLNLICTTIPGQPGQDCQKYQPLIVLALGTADSILAILQPPTQKALPQVRLVSAPKNEKEFKTRWNAIVAADPALAKAKL